MLAVKIGPQDTTALLLCFFPICFSYFGWRQFDLFDPFDVVRCPYQIRSFAETLEAPFLSFFNL